MWPGTLTVDFQLETRKKKWLLKPRTLPLYCQWSHRLFVPCQRPGRDCTWDTHNSTGHCAGLAVDAKLCAFVLTSLDLHWLLLMRLKRNKNCPQIKTGLFLQSHPTSLLYWSVKPHEFFKLVNDVNWQVKLLQWKPCCANLIYVVGPQNRFLSDCFFGFFFSFKTKVRIFFLKSRGFFCEDKSHQVSCRLKLQIMLLLF